MTDDRVQNIATDFEKIVAAIARSSAREPKKNEANGLVRTVLVHGLAVAALVEAIKAVLGL